ncbi:ethylene-responsive transcription factor RAP2-11-like [Carya illinoinensis]|uniref:ethylene-responsive transcription factor RAP2-11-like n=1 Tax=Carya illinoinensis TaxID=32201 RepID=UPI001C71AB79|nr:ethylene-responsive transcription factor RAP2-11-like [Carya illinoinensis]
MYLESNDVTQLLRRFDHVDSWIGGGGDHMGAPNDIPRGRSRKSSSSGHHRFVGVQQRPSGRWVAEIKDSLHKVRLRLGTFNTTEDAAHAYDVVARNLRSANARTNFELLQFKSNTCGGAGANHVFNESVEPFSFKQGSYI